MRVLMLSSIVVLFAACQSSPNVREDVDCGVIDTPCACADGYVPMWSACDSISLPACGVECSPHGGILGVVDMGTEVCASNADCTAGYACTYGQSCDSPTCTQRCDVDAGTSCLIGTCGQATVVGTDGGNAIANVCVHDNGC